MAVAKVAKVIEITSASSESFEDAIRQGIAQVVAGASHLFEEPGTLETVAHLAERLVRPPPCPNPGIQAGAADPPKEETPMGVCEVCGSDCDKSMAIFIRDRTHVFDCFECAIMPSPLRAMQLQDHRSPREHNDVVYWCAHCAHKAGVQEAVDRA